MEEQKNTEQAVPEVPQAEPAEPVTNEPVKVQAVEAKAEPVPKADRTADKVVNVLENLQEQVKKLQDELVITRDAATKAADTAQQTEQEALEYARKNTLDQLGVKDQYREYAPTTDPRTNEGKAALERWASERPAMVTSRRPEPDVKDWSALGGDVAEIMSGKRKSYWLTPNSIQTMLSNKGDTDK